MVSTRKKRQSNRSLLSHLDDFDQDMIIGNAVSERQENIVVNEVPVSEILPLVFLVVIQLGMRIQ